MARQQPVGTLAFALNFSLTVLYHASGDTHGAAASLVKKDTAAVQEARAVSRMLRDGVSDDWPLQKPFEQNDWGAFVNSLGIGMNNRVPPLTPNERNTASHFDMLIHLVLTEPNEERQRLDPPQHFTFGEPERTECAQGGERPINVTGVSGNMIRRHSDPYCIIEHKHHETTDSLFDEGGDQALIYAAAIRTRNPMRPVLAIVTDLDRWRFLRVDERGCKESKVLATTASGIDLR